MQRKRVRTGYSVVELLIALTLIGIAATMVLPSVGKTLGKTRVARAASVLAGDLQLAQTTAARTRTPVRVTVDASGKMITVQNHATPATVYAQRYYGKQSENAVQTFTSDVASVVLYPNGRAASSIRFTLATSGESRTVQMNIAGQVRIK